VAGRALWRTADAVPEPVRALLRPLVARARRARTFATPLPDGARPELPPSAVELDTLIGTLWFDGEDEKLTPWIRRHATWEADVVRLLEATLRPGGTFVDVGANVGFHSVVAARLVGPSGRVVALEPEPQSAAILRANLWRHSVPNALVHAVAASDRPGRVRLAPDPEGRSGSALSASGGIEADAARLDDLLDGATVDVLKVDVEGAEPLVLRGAEDTIRRSLDLVAVVEFRLERHLDGSEPTDVLAYYESLGLRLGLLRPSGDVQPASADDVLRAAEHAPTLNIVLRR
jgi:FkbM family methyltransferase